jgi:Protein of unknown function (DUF1344)
MRKIVVPAVVSAALAVSSLAFASQIATGKITQLDSNAQTMRLDNGVLYHLPNDFKTSSLKAGEQVTVTWSMENGEYKASDIKLSSF